MDLPPTPRKGTTWQTLARSLKLDFKASIPADTYYLRLHDSSIGFDIENSTQRFALLKSPFDCVLYRKGRMYCLELKTTLLSSVSYLGSSPMIKEHQIKE